MSELKDFLAILESEPLKTNEVVTTTKKVKLSPLTFKQQKSLVTSGMDGVVGVMSFIKNLNEIIIFNTGEDDLKIYDRIPIALNLRKSLSSKPLTSGESSVSVETLLNNNKLFLNIVNTVVDGGEFKINLRIPTLLEENRILSSCIDELKKISSDNYSKNISTILSYEIPKFIKSFQFGDNEIQMDTLSLSDRVKIMDNIPANITNQITEFIVKIREYDESILTYDGVTYDVDSSLFE
jgi:hypothetical protein